MPASFGVAAPDGEHRLMLVVAADGIALTASNALAEALGYDEPRQLEGRAAHDALHYKRPDGSRFPEPECPLMRPLLDGAAASGGGEWLVRRDGSMLPVSWSSRPVLLDGAAAALQSFTVRKPPWGPHVVEELEPAEVQQAVAGLLASDAVRRQRTARRLHEGLQQRLLLSSMHIALAQESLLSAPPEVLTSLEQARQHLQAAIDQARTIAREIYPAQLSSRGLYAAVETLVDTTSVVLVLSGAVPERLPWDVEMNVYDVVVQVVSAAERVSLASEVRVTLTVSEAHLVLDVGVTGPGAEGLLGSRAGREPVDRRLLAVGATAVVWVSQRGHYGLRAVVALPPP